MKNEMGESDTLPIVDKTKGLDETPDVGGVSDMVVTKDINIRVDKVDDSRVGLLEEEIIIGSVSFQMTDVPGVPIEIQPVSGKTIDHVDLLRMWLSSPIIIDQVRGYGGVSFDSLELTININASPLHAGQYMISYYPLSGARGVVAGAADPVVEVRKTRTGMMAQKHIVFSILEPTVSLAVPMITPFHHFETSVSRNDLCNGRMYIVPIIPLKAADGQPPVINGSLTLKASGVSLNRKIVPMSASNSKGSFPLTGNEFERPVSKALNAGGDLLEVLGMLPVPGAGIARTSAPIARAIAGVAASAGYSEGDKQDPMMISNTKNVGNATGQKIVHSSAFNSDVETNLSPLGFDKTDEMSFAHIFDHWALVGDYEVNKDSRMGIEVAAIDLNITDIKEEIAIKQGDKSVTCEQRSGFCELANSCFVFWRGDVMIRILGNATSVIGGSLLVFYEPPGSDKGTLANQSYVYRRRIPINTLGDIEMRIPWTLPNNVAPVDNSIGTLRIIVETPLVAPSTVPQAVTLAVFMKPCCDTTTMVGAKGYNLTMEGVMPQAGVCGIGSSKTEITDFAVIGNSHGDFVGSVKTMVNQSTRWYYDQTTWPTDFDKDEVELDPFFFSHAVPNETGVWNGSCGGDALNFFSSWYAGHNGDVVVGVSGHTLTRGTLKYSAPPNGRNVVTRKNPSLDGSYAWCNGNTGMVPLAHNAHTAVPWIEFLVPACHGGMFVPLVTTHTVTRVGLPECKERTTIVIDYVLEGKDPVEKRYLYDTTQWYRRAADNFQFGFFLGPLPMASRVRTTLDEEEKVENPEIETRKKKKRDKGRRFKNFKFLSRRDRRKDSVEKKEFCKSYPPAYQEEWEPWKAKVEGTTKYFVRIGGVTKEILEEEAERLMLEHYETAFEL